MNSRSLNLLCERCLLSSVVDQRKVIGPAMVDGVAREFDLGDNTTCGALPVPVPSPNLDKFDFVK
ncbi:MAG TPA: hypothetical protein VIH75_15580 [Candidatus Sulfotelmatobacter sp.]